MKDAMISVRLPSTLIQQLKDLAEKHHYLDMSEQVREILRIKCAQYLAEPQKKPVPTTETSDKQRLVESLQQIIDQIKKGM